MAGQRISSLRLTEEARDLPIGERLSEFRKAKGLTLAQLSELTAISESTLSRAENGITPLNAHNLYILAKVLEVDIVAFFRSDAESFTRGKRVVTRRGTGEWQATQRYELELLCADLSSKKMVPSRNRIVCRTLLETGGLRSHEGEEFLFVLSGEVQVHTALCLPERLVAGDSMYFDGNIAHAYVNAGAEPAEILVVTAVETPP